MPRNRKYHPGTPVVASDRLVVRAMKDVPEYNPRNPDYSPAALQSVEAELTQAEDELNRLILACDAARQRVADKSWELHERVLGAKAEVLAQFGPDSPAIKAIGLTRKSERKRPARRRVAPVQ